MHQPWPILATAALALMSVPAHQEASADPLQQSVAPRKEQAEGASTAAQLTIKRIFKDKDFKTESFGPYEWLDEGAAYTTVEEENSALEQTPPPRRRAQKKGAMSKPTTAKRTTGTRTTAKKRVAKRRMLARTRNLVRRLSNTTRTLASEKCSYRSNS